MKDIKEIVATNISELRKASGYTQITFSEQINYSNKTVSKWERGESTPDIETLLQLASLFGVSLQYFVEEHDQNDKVMKAKSQKPKLQLCINLLGCALFGFLLPLFSYIMRASLLHLLLFGKCLFGQYQHLALYFNFSI